MLTTGLRIKKLRKQKRLTQYKLSEKIGCHPTTVAYWESDRNLPRGDSLVALALVLDVPVVELLTGKGGEDERSQNPRE